MNPRLSAEQSDTVDRAGCVEIKNLDGHCVLMSAEALRAMRGVRVDIDGDGMNRCAIDRSGIDLCSVDQTCIDQTCKQDCQKCLASLGRSCGQSRRIRRGH
jgi:hypothetical protein